MKRLLYVVCIAAYILLYVPPVYAGQVNIIKTVYEPVSSQPYVKVYAHSFPSPSSMNVTDITGNITFQSGLSYIAQGAYMIWYRPTGSCPADGTIFSTYQQIVNAYPGALNFNAVNTILSKPGTVTLPLDVHFPIKRPVSGCVFATFDMAAFPNGTTANTGITLTSNITLTYDTGTPAPSAPWFPLGPEICYGTNQGCTKATTCTSSTCAYMQVTKNQTSQYLWSLFGDVTTGTFSGTPYGTAPTGTWNAGVDIYLYKNCTLSSGLYGPADYYTQIPANAIPLLSVPMQSHDNEAVHAPVAKSFQPVFMEQGSCLVHLTKFSSQNGSATVNSSVYALTKPLQKADYDHSGHITIVDFVLFMNYWWTNNVANADFNGDGKINAIDYTIFMNYWQESP